MRNICLKWHDFDLITVMRLMEYWIMNIDYQLRLLLWQEIFFLPSIIHIYVEIGRDVWNLCWRLKYSNSVRNKKEELLVLLYAWFSLDSIRIHSIAYYVTTNYSFVDENGIFFGGLMLKVSFNEALVVVVVETWETIFFPGFLSWAALLRF